MGLLDDAIREHLEFKRQRGANPEEVAQQEHEALGPIEREDHATESSTDVAGPMASGGADWERGAADLAASAVIDEESKRGPYTGDETAELDMSTVLEAERPVGAHPPDPEESLEWEVPATTKAGKPAGDSPETIEDEDEGSADDVLEETPDFLRESPDQERLWFEQQPPRDFDFDK